MGNFMLGIVIIDVIGWFYLSNYLFMTSFNGLNWNLTNSKRFQSNYLIFETLPWTQLSVNPW